MFRRHNHQLAVWVQALWCRRWGVEPSTPLDGSMLGSMVTVALPPQAPQRFESSEALQARLFEQHRIEIPVIDWAGRWWIRKKMPPAANRTGRRHTRRSSLTGASRSSG